jgi:DNA-binding NarL/FixJ family response regulator
MEKLHQEKDWLQSQIDSGKSSKQIANENNISYKLVEIYLSKFNIPFKPKERVK